MESIGVVIIAMGTRSYGEMAFNLAVSLKACFDVPITIVGNQVKKILRYHAWIDNTVAPPSTNPFEIKASMWDVSPYEKTLYIDADSLFTGDDLQGFLKEIDSHSFLIGEYKKWKKGEIPKKYTWAKFPEIWTHYELKDNALFPECNSSMFYFDRSKGNEELFRAVRDAYKNPVRVNKSAGGYFPDEVAWGAGQAITGRYSDVPGWMPCYFNWHSDSNPESYRFVSMAGQHQPPKLIQVYNRRMAQNALTYKLHQFKFKPEGKLYGFV